MKDTLKPGATAQFAYRVPAEKTVPHLYREAPEFGEMPTVRKLAGRAGIAVGEQQRRFLAPRLDSHRIDREDVGPVEEIGDPAEALRLALGAVVSARPVETHQRRVGGWRGLGLDRQLEGSAARRFVQGEPLTRRLVASGFKRLAVDRDGKEGNSVAVEHERRRRRNACPPLDRQFRDHARAVWIEPEDQRCPWNEPVARAIILEPEHLAGICPHSVISVQARRVVQQGQTNWRDKVVC